MLKPLSAQRRTKSDLSYSVPWHTTPCQESCSSMADMPSDQEVADALRAVRAALGISVREQARRADVSPSTMSRWCSREPLDHPMSLHRPKAERYLATVAEADAKGPGERRAKTLAGALVDRIEAALTSADAAPEPAGGHPPDQEEGGLGTGTGG